MEAPNDDYIISRRFIYGLEFVASEMELKVGQVQHKNYENKIFDKTYPDAEKKILAVRQAQDYLYKLYEEIERIKKVNFRLDFENKKLLAENMTLKK